MPQRREPVGILVPGVKRKQLGCPALCFRNFRYRFGQIRTRELRKSARKQQSGDFASSQISTALAPICGRITQSREATISVSNPVRVASSFHRLIKVKSNQECILKVKSFCGRALAESKYSLERPVSAWSVKIRLNFFAVDGIR